MREYWASRRITKLQEDDRAEQFSLKDLGLKSDSADMVLDAQGDAGILLVYRGFLAVLTIGTDSPDSRREKYAKVSFNGDILPVTSDTQDYDPELPEITVDWNTKSFSWNYRNERP